MTEKEFVWWIEGSEANIDWVEQDPDHILAVGEAVGMRLDNVASVHSLVWTRTAQRIDGTGVAVTR